MKANRSFSWLLLPLFALIAFTLLSAFVSADDVFTNIENGMANALGTSATIAGYLLTAGLCGAIAIALAIAGVNPYAELVTIMMILAFCVIVGWADFWILIICAMIVVVAFSGKLAGIISGQGPE